MRKRMQARLVTATAIASSAWLSGCVFWDMSGWVGSGSDSGATRDAIADHAVDHRFTGRDAIADHGGGRGDAGHDATKESVPEASCDPGTTGYAAVVLADSPLGYWPLDDPANSTSARDLSCYHHDATVVGTVTFGVMGQVGTGAGFGGAGSLQVGSLFAVPHGGSLSIEAWVQATTISTAGPVYLELAARYTPNPTRFGYDVWVFQQSPTAEAGIGFELLPDGGYGWSATGGISLGTYAHIVGTYDAESQLEKMYVDGVLSRQQQGPPPGDVDASFMWAASSNGIAHFVGSLDELAIYGQALDAPRVMAHYQAGVADGGS
jgi:Concanavalin A-like lectin/glucanases superfamily